MALYQIELVESPIEVKIGPDKIVTAPIGAYGYVMLDYPDGRWIVELTGGIHGEVKGRQVQDQNPLPIEARKGRPNGLPDRALFVFFPLLKNSYRLIRPN